VEKPTKTGNLRFVQIKSQQQLTLGSRWFTQVTPGKRYWKYQGGGLLGIGVFNAIITRHRVSDEAVKGGIRANKLVQNIS